jgi:predicted TIM-barrel fold metal-dependent hydrolase
MIDLLQNHPSLMPQDFSSPWLSILGRLVQIGLVACGGLLLQTAAGAEEDWTAVRRQAGEWRAEHRIIDLHQHLDYKPELLARAIRVMDAAGVGVGIDLTPGTVTPGPNGEPSEFERHKRLEDTLFPGRWVQYMNLDYKNWDQPDFAEQAVRQAEEGHRLGAAGFKQEKSLGLYLRDGQGKLLQVDDPKLDPLWERLGQLNMPISIHVADPKAFFEPYNDKNERWKELKDHPRWWFGDTNKFPTFHGMLEALNRVIARHPHTTFVCVHFGNNAEELDWVDQSLAKYPNMMVDLAARIPEIGRHDPEQVHKLFVKYQDRIFFGTDFQSLESKMILGSSGNEPPPAVADAEVFYAKEWRWLETADKNWEHMTPIQGDWTISSIHLPAAVLRKIYFDNAQKLLARSLPAPTIQARHTTRDFDPDGDLAKAIWQTATPVRLERVSSDATARPDLCTSVRALWSEAFLYLAYECPYTELTVFEPIQDGRKRFDLGQTGASLWDRDVVEAFIGNDPQNPAHYGEFEVAPSNERLDVMVVNLPEKDFAWDSQFRSAVRVDSPAKRWTCEMRIPLRSIGGAPPAAGTRWRLNLFRCDRANQAFLAWRPTLTPSFHTPERFGTLEFVE